LNITDISGHPADIFGHKTDSRRSACSGPRAHVVMPAARLGRAHAVRPYGAPYKARSLWRRWVGGGASYLERKYQIQRASARGRAPST